MVSSLIKEETGLIKGRQVPVKGLLIKWMVIGGGGTEMDHS